MKILWTLLTVSLFIASFYVFQDNVTSILINIPTLGWLAPPLFLLLYGVGTVFLFPTMILTLAGGALFGPFYGMILNLLGATGVLHWLFFISRYWGNKYRFINKRKLNLNKLNLKIEKNSWKFVALLRLIPILPFTLVNYGLGLTQIKFSHYIISTFFFSIPAELLYTYCGYLGKNFLIHPSSLYKNVVILTLLILGLIVLINDIVKYYLLNPTRLK